MLPHCSEANVAMPAATVYIGRELSWQVLWSNKQ